MWTSPAWRYLTPSKEKMKAKGVKSVQSRVCNLKELNPAVTADAMRQALKESFFENYGDFTELDPAQLDNPEVQRRMTFIPPGNGGTASRRSARPLTRTV